MQKSDLIPLTNSFYQLSHIPMYLLDQAGKLQVQTKAFPSLPGNFFCCFMNMPLHERYHFYFNPVELYVSFPLQDALPYTHAIIGPILYQQRRHSSDEREFSLFRYGNLTYDALLMQHLPVLNDRFYGYIQILYTFFYGTELTHEQFHEDLYQPRKLKYEKQVYDILFSQREDFHDAYSYQTELKLLHAIKQGDSANARVYASMLGNGRIGPMSEDHLRKSKYAIITSIALITRAVIEAGVAVENAYALSDVYIQKIDNEYDHKKLLLVFFDAIMDFCSLVKLTQHQDVPAWVRACMEYINQHLHTTIPLHELSEHVHMAPAYMSVQFKKITGKSIKQYSNEQKIKEAKYLLITTDKSIQEIALILAYGTQSYFTKVFKEITGEVPAAYRNRKRTNLSSSNL